MKIQNYLDKNNLHHAYLLEGARTEILPQIFEFFEHLNIQTISNPDFYHAVIDNLKMEEALELRALSANKSFSDSSTQIGKKIFVLCVNTFSLDAQGVLLKMFEEPIENTHFFLIVPDINILLKTLVSRFYLISSKPELTNEKKEAEKFTVMSLKNRLDFIKELLADSEEKDAEGNEIVVLDSTRAKALKFLNALESVLHNKMSKNISAVGYFEQIFKVRKFLRMPGSSAKSLMESVALILPEKII